MLPWICRGSFIDKEIAFYEFELLCKFES